MQLLKIILLTANPIFHAARIHLLNSPPMTGSVKKIK